MPARGDHEARRRDVSRAVSQVLAAHGFGGLTLRAVAAEMGASTGLLTHYFPDKHSLIRHALEVTEELTAKRARHDGTAEGLAGLRAALLDVLPLAPESVAMNRVWVSFWDAALHDPELAAHERDRYERWREGRLRPFVDAAIRRRELPAGSDADEIVAAAAAFAHGIVVHALFDPDRYPPSRQTALVDRFVRTLRQP